MYIFLLLFDCHNSKIRFFFFNIQLFSARPTIFSLGGILCLLPCLSNQHPQPQNSIEGVQSDCTSDKISKFSQNAFFF